MTLGYHIEKDIVANSREEVVAHASDPADYLRFLLEPVKDLKVLWHLNYSTAQLARMLNLDKEQGRLLWQYHKVWDSKSNCTISHTPKKYLSLDYGEGLRRPFANFADMQQYEEGEIDNEERTPEYCVKKAKEAKRIGDSAIAAFNEVGVEAQSLTSPIRAFDRATLRHLDFPTVDDVPEEAGEMAWETCLGGWFEAFARGKWQVYNYDIIGAYPYQLTQLPDLRLGQWAHASEKPYDSILGFARGEVTISSDFSPISLSKENVVPLEEGEYMESRGYTAKGTWERTLTQDQIEFIERHKLGSFIVYDGHWWTCKPENLRYPFRQVILELYSKRGQCSPLAEAIVKRIGSGIYGMCRQLIQQKTGPYFNPVYASLVETRTSLEVARACIESGIVPLHIMLDSVMTEKPLLDSCLGTELGQWKLKSNSPCIIVSSGIVAGSSRESRSDFSLSYEKMAGMIEKFPLECAYPLKRTGFVSIGTALNSDRWQDVGKVEEQSRVIYVDSESERYYPQSPKTGQELISGQYYSEPWDAEVLESML